MNILEELQNIFRTVFEDDSISIKPEMSRDNPETISGWDSIKNVELLYEVEQQFGIKLTIQQLQSIKTVI
jgi:acyl carrier protein